MNTEQRHRYGGGERNQGREACPQETATDAAELQALFKHPVLLTEPEIPQPDVNNLIGKSK
jgi:hypothetical protein